MSHDYDVSCPALSPPLTGQGSMRLKFQTAVVAPLTQAYAINREGFGDVSNTFEPLSLDQPYECRIVDSLTKC